MSSVPDKAFRPKARLLQLLGDQLIGSPRLAVFELVKNAYDADAHVVTVQMNNVESAAAEIIVEDDGDGMSLETIRDIWLVLAHGHRSKQREAGIRTRLGRTPLGEKGVGRFAVHKLGNKVELISRAAGRKECRVMIDWDQMLANDVFLDEALVHVEEREPEWFKGETKGTQIRITELRASGADAWSRGQVRRLFRQITSISSPFSKRSDEFNVLFEVPDRPQWLTGLPTIETLMKSAPWYFAFDFIDGRISFRYQFRGAREINLPARSVVLAGEPLQIETRRDRGLFGEDQTPVNTRAKKVVADAKDLVGIGPIRGKFFVFDRAKEVLDHVGESKLVREMLDEHGGIRIYRDGIRVYNYGEPSDDWLGLGQRRVNDPSKRIGRNLVFGAIDLDLAASPALREKTNREGFVEDEALVRLREVVLGAISVLEIERNIDKDAIRRATAKHPGELGSDALVAPLAELRRLALKHHVPEEFEAQIARIERNLTEFRDAVLHAGLAGTGLAVVFHQVEQEVRILNKAIQAGISTEQVRERMRDLVHMLDGFGDLVRRGANKQVSLQHLVDRAVQINASRFRHHAVDLTFARDPGGESDFAQVNVDFGLTLGALNNLLDNAFYWLQFRWADESATERRKIYVSVLPDFTSGPAVLLADTGPGFMDSPDRLTQPFFTRRPEGMGLGLYYSRMVMELAGGRLIFPQSRDGLGIPAEFDGAIVILAFPAIGGR